MRNCVAASVVMYGWMVSIRNMGVVSMRNM